MALLMPTVPWRHQPMSKAPSTSNQVRSEPERVPRQHIPQGVPGCFTVHSFASQRKLKHTEPTSPSSPSPLSYKETVPDGFPQRQEACVHNPVCISCEDAATPLGYDGGLPLELSISVTSAGAGCAALAGDGVVVDIWQADPAGVRRLRLES